jgi:Uncharacterized protein conserved in bacteria (DUF2147)
MRPATLAALGLLALAGAAQAQTQARSPDPSGTYLSEAGEFRVRVARCGAAYCGTIVSVQGDAKDLNNPDPNMRTRSLVGIRMI